MAINALVSALTAQLRGEFWRGWNDVAEPAPWEEFTTIIPSGTRVENYVNFTPVPGMTEWKGQRAYGSLDSFIYSLANKTYSNGIRATLEDVEDDQTGGLVNQVKDLVEKAKVFRGRETLRTLSVGATTPCFDGTNFFADSHVFGTGDNKLTYTGTADASGTIYKVIALFYGNKVLKPMLWQNRSGPDFETNSGEQSAKESRQFRWWCDLRGAAGYGYWWNAVLTTITNLPTITDMHSIYSNIEVAFRSFTMPAVISTEPLEYVHEQTVFSDKNLYLVGSTGLSELLRTSLNQDSVPRYVAQGQTSSIAQTAPTTNTWKGFAKYAVTNYLNP